MSIQIPSVLFTFGVHSLTQFVVDFPGPYLISSLSESFFHLQNSHSGTLIASHFAVILLLHFVSIALVLNCCYQFQVMMHFMELLDLM